MVKVKRTGYKHGKWVTEPVPHADIGKYVDKGTGKEDTRAKRSRIEGSTLKFKKPKRLGTQSPGATRPKGGARIPKGAEIIGKPRKPKKDTKVGKAVKPKPTITIKKIEPEFTVTNTGSTEGMRDARKIEGKPHSSPEGRFESQMRSIPLKVVTFKNGGKVRIAKKGGGRAYGQNS